MKFKVSSILSLLLAILVFSSNPPWFIWGFNYYLIFSVILLILGLIFFGKKKCDKNLFYALPIVLLSIIYFILIKSLGEFRFSTVLLFLIYLSLFFIDEEDKKNGFNIFSNFLFVLILISLPLWLIHNFVFTLPYSFPLAYDQSLGKGEGLIFWNYIFFIQPELDYFRFYSVFDEPGVLGLLCTIVLFVNNYNFSEKKNIVILLGGIFTFSLAFYIFTFIGYIFHVLMQRKLKSLLFAFILFISLTPFLITIESFRLSIVDRFNNFKQSLLERNGIQLDQFYDVFIYTPNFYYGESLDFFSKNSYLKEGQSYKFFFIEYGIIGFLLMIFLYLFLIDKRKVNIYVIFLLIIFILSFIQRPFMFTPWQIALFSMALPYLYKEGKK
ncbi:MAG: hypothetical protein ACK4KU_07960 [Acinetobacter sp.]|uniref:hypothetical protein n=1 Tax=Acinetobacter sp. TaxID=472 RepID=UPI00391C1CC8